MILWQETPRHSEAQSSRQGQLLVVAGRYVRGTVPLWHLLGGGVEAACLTELSAESPPTQALASMPSVMRSRTRSGAGSFLSLTVRVQLSRPTSSDSGLLRFSRVSSSIAPRMYLPRERHRTRSALTNTDRIHKTMKRADMLTTAVRAIAI